MTKEDRAKLLESWEEINRVDYTCSQPTCGYCRSTRNRQTHLCRVYYMARMLHMLLLPEEEF